MAHPDHPAVFRSIRSHLYNTPECDEVFSTYLITTHHAASQCPLNFKICVNV